MQILNPLLNDGTLLVSSSSLFLCFLVFIFSFQLMKCCYASEICNSYPVHAREVQFILSFSFWILKLNNWFNYSSFRISSVHVQVGLSLTDCKFTTDISLCTAISKFCISVFLDFNIAFMIVHKTDFCYLTAIATENHMNQK